MVYQTKITVKLAFPIIAIRWMGKIRLQIKKDAIDAKWDCVKAAANCRAVAKIKGHGTEDEVEVRMI
jgi:hypothetical protein